MLVLLYYTHVFVYVHIPLLKRTVVLWHRGNFLLRVLLLLFYRTQLVKLVKSKRAPCKSSPISINRGVIQCSVLGPILFAILTSDVTITFEHRRFYLYADETQLYLNILLTSKDVVSTIDNNNDDLVSVRWLDRNGLALKPSKSICIIYGTEIQVQAIKSYKPNIEIENSMISWCESGGNLGLYIRQTLTFEAHVQQKICKCFEYLNKLYKQRQLLSDKVSKTV